METACVAYPTITSTCSEFSQVCQVLRDTPISRAARSRDQLTLSCHQPDSAGHLLAHPPGSAEPAGAVSG
ncbi:TPA: hypothetical protein RU568_004108 [Salmonella enterica]|nr:hypothetical protein [Salmonella enterica]